MENTQTTNHLLMVRPVCFAFNEETATNNVFQQRCDSAESDSLQNRALAEFDTYVSLLRKNGVDVTVIQDTPVPFTPDSIFPNNNFTTHRHAEGHILVLYPLFAPNRREERAKLLPTLMSMAFDRVIDLSHWTDEDHYLEGTGSLILDREHHIAFACRSPRTHEEVLNDWSKQTGYDYFLFDSVDNHGMPIYHTNVMMHIGTHTAVVCMESIRDSGQRTRLQSVLEANGKTVVAISMEQMRNFAGNILEVHNDKGEHLLVMSATARESLTDSQLNILSRHTRILAPKIHTIETTGGGSARCMIAELF